ncbi:unnamed protein product, partial [Ectocarpus sp. 8 AP-2014]
WKCCCPCCRTVLRVLCLSSCTCAPLLCLKHLRSRTCRTFRTHLSAQVSTFVALILQPLPCSPRSMRPYAHVSALFVCMCVASFVFFRFFLREVLLISPAFPLNPR